MDATRVGHVAAELMERIADEFGEDAEIGVVGVVVEVNHVEGDDQVTTIRYRCSDGRRWIQGAIFDRARAAAHADQA